MVRVLVRVTNGMRPPGAAVVENRFIGCVNVRNVYICIITENCVSFEMLFECVSSNACET